MPPFVTFNLSIEEANMIIQGLTYVNRDSQALIAKLQQAATHQIQQNNAAAAEAAAEAAKSENAIDEVKQAQ